MPDPGDGSARPGAAASGVALAVLSAGTFGTSGIFASVLISAGWSPPAVAIARLGEAAVLWGLLQAVCLAAYFLLAAPAGEAVLPPLVMAWGGLCVSAVFLAVASVTGVLHVTANAGDAV